MADEKAFPSRSTQDRSSSPESWIDQSDPTAPLIETELESRHGKRSPTPSTHSPSTIALICLALVSLAAFLYHDLTIARYLKAHATHRASSENVSASSGSRGCQNIATRPSWRRMSYQGKKAYIAAVLCMAERPSRLHLNSSLYDDFTYMHVVNGAPIRRQASDFPFNRLHLHIWEKTLRAECDYNGRLPYWDWELDYVEPSRSPIFDANFGFGGDGGKHDERLSSEYKSHSEHQRCIQKGPFTRLRPRWSAPWTSTTDAFSLQNEPHCITRAFSRELDDLQSERSKAETVDFSSPRIEKILANQVYSDFHDPLVNISQWAPRAIGGDFATYAAPNDPIYYLYMSNIDRLWWRWQQYHSFAGSVVYNSGEEEKSVWNSEGLSRLDDPLSFTAYPGVQSGIKVRDMMDTRSGIMGMCYRY